MDLNIRTKIDINAVCTCGNPLDITYHAKWYGRYALGVKPCEVCSGRTLSLRRILRAIWRRIDGE